MHFSNNLNSGSISFTIVCNSYCTFFKQKIGVIKLKITQSNLVSVPIL